jgi:hypothetical protein
MKKFIVVEKGGVLKPVTERRSLSEFEGSGSPGHSAPPYSPPDPVIATDPPAGGQREGKGKEVASGSNLINVRKLSKY